MPQDDVYEIKGQGRGSDSECYGSEKEAIDLNLEEWVKSEEKENRYFRPEPRGG